MKVDVFLIRHGETDWNVEQRFQGQTDIPLNKAGETQATALAEIIKKIDPDIFLSSDLQRAIRTAELANIFKRPHEKSKHLRESHLGKMEGLVRNEVVKALGPAEWAKWTDNQNLDFSLPGGETKRQVLQRALDTLKEFTNRHSHIKKVAVVTHGGVVKRLIHYVLSAPDTKVGLHNCVVHHLHYHRGLDQWTYLAEISAE